jgi:hypothetical protein
MSKKLCPLMSRIVHPIRSAQVAADLMPVYCQKHDCQLWDYAYVTPIEEGSEHRIEGCSFQIGAKTNAEGRIPI